MRRSTILRVSVLALAVLLAVEGSALAAFIEPTSLSIHRSPSGRVDPGTKITIRGRLSSDRRACRSHKVIKLVRVGVGVVELDITNRFGRYRFDRRIRRTQRFRTKFAGTARGVHPDFKICLASTSRTIKVRVRR
ncbi:MAG: hypothetical protein ACRDG8_00905 [Actinomycetota bacterium]